VKSDLKLISFWHPLAAQLSSGQQSHFETMFYSEFQLIVCKVYSFGANLHG
jgi:hypothetical protein